MRELVLRLPLGIRYNKTDIEREIDERIFACEIDDKIVASCQFIVKDGKAKMRQVATARPYQGKGIGRDLYLFSELELKSADVKEIFCHARKTAVSFYKKLGFNIVSEEFQEVGIPHLKMKKDLS
jgi:predicted GNAT family N-acyltransferase